MNEAVEAVVAKRLRRVEVLTAALRRERGVSLELTRDQWAWVTPSDGEPPTLRVARHSLLRESDEALAGYVAHEIGHDEITRYHAFTLDFPSAVARQYLLNCIEDPRVNRYMMRRWPGVRRWLTHVYRASTSPESADPLSHFLGYCGGLVCAGTDTLHGLPQPARPGILQAYLDRTLPDCEAYWNELPADGHGQSALNAAEAACWQNEIAPHLTPEWRNIQPDGDEFQVYWSAWQAQQHLTARVLPTAEQCWRRDVRALNNWLCEDSLHVMQVQVALASRSKGLLEQVVAVGLYHGAGDDDHPLERGHSWAGLAKRLFEAYLQARRNMGGDWGLSSRPGRRRSPSSTSASSHRDSPGLRTRAPSTSTQLAKPPSRADIEDQTCKLTQYLERILEPRHCTALTWGYPSGNRLHLPSAMSVEADPRVVHRLWGRRLAPETREAALLLLIDLSGSMRGEKASAAIMACRVISEAMLHLGIPRAIFGFQDETIPLIDFGDTDPERCLRASESIAHEIRGDNPGGHNRPLWNDDGPCLEAAARHLCRRPERDRLLIVVSDGVPEGRRSDSADLKRAIARVERVRNLELIGVGLGKRTTHVRDFYPRCLAQVPPTEFAEQLARLIGDAMKSKA